MTVPSPEPEPRFVPPVETASSVSLVSLGAPVLRTVCESTAHVVRDELEDLADRITAVLLDRDAPGVAAPQIGTSIRMVVLNAAHMCQIADRVGHRDAVIHLDPSWEAVAAQEHGVPEYAADFEGCLSVPRISGVVERNRYVRYRATTPDGSRVDWFLRGRAARVVQHEVDHLDGVPIVDRAPAAACAPSAPLTASTAVTRRPRPVGWCSDWSLPPPADRRDRPPGRCAWCPLWSIRVAWAFSWPFR